MKNCFGSTSRISMFLTPCIAMASCLYIASDLQLQHSLSIMDYDSDMTPERYGNFLAAEGTFFFLRRSPLDNVALTVRLLARGTKQNLRYNNKTFAEDDVDGFLP